jgi:hypothetical protein
MLREVADRVAARGDDRPDGLVVDGVPDRGEGACEFFVGDGVGGRATRFRVRGPGGVPTDSRTAPSAPRSWRAMNCAPDAKRRRTESPARAASQAPRERR